MMLLIVFFTLLSFQAADALRAPASLNELIEQFFTTYNRSDLDGHLACYAEKSPQLAERRTTLKKLFADGKTERIRQHVIRDKHLARTPRRVRLTVERLPEIEPDSKSFVAEELVLRVVREGDGWKVWRCTDPVSDVVKLLEETTDKEQRATLLQSERDGLSAGVVRELNCRTFAFRGKPEAERLNAVALEAAEALRQPLPLAWARLHRSQLLVECKQYAAALAEVEKALPAFRAEPDWIEQFRLGYEVEEQQGLAVALVVRGRCLAALEKGADALKCFREAHTLFEELAYSVPFAKRLPGIARHYLDRIDERDRLEEEANSLEQWDRTEQKRRLVEAGLKIEKELFGDCHLDVAGSFIWLTGLRTQQGEYQPAEELARLAVTVCRRLAAEDEIVFATARRNLELVQRLSRLETTQRARYWEAYGGFRRSLRLRGEQKDREVLPLRQAYANCCKDLLGGDSLEYARALYHLGLAQQRLRQYQLAAASLRLSHAGYRRAFGASNLTTIEVVKSLADVLESQATDRLNADDLDAARKLLEEAEALCSEALGRDQQDTVVRRWLLEHVKAVQVLGPEDRKRVHNARREIRAARRGRDRNTLALKLRQDLPAIRSLVGENDVLYLDGLLLMYETLRDLARHEEATGYLHHAVEWLKRQEASRVSTEKVMIVWFYQGSRALRENNFSRALECFHTAADMAETLGDRRAAEIVCLQIGDCYWGLNEVSRAVHYYLSATLTIKKSLQGQKARGEGPLRLLKVDVANTQLTQTHENLALAYMKLGEVYTDQNRHDANIAKLLGMSLEIVKKMKGAESEFYLPALTRLAELYRLNHDEKRGKASYEELIDGQLRLANFPGWATAKRGYGILLLESGEHAQAEKELRTALRAQERLLGPDAEALEGTQAWMGRALRATGKLDDAVYHLEKCLALKHSRQRRLLQVLPEGRYTAVDDSEMYDLLGELVYLANARQQENPACADLACNWVLRIKGVKLESLCRQKELARTLDADPPLKEQWQEWQRKRQQLVALRAQPPETSGGRGQQQHLTEEIDTLEGKLKTTLLEKARPGRKELPEATTAAVQQQLPPDSALIEYVRVQDWDITQPAGKRNRPPRYFACVIRSDAREPPRLFDLGPAAEIDGVTAGLRTHLETFHLKVGNEGEKALEAAFKDSAAQLFDKLIATLKPALGDVKTLLVSPDGELHRVPFAALVDKQQGYLLEKYRIGYLSSGRDLLRPPPDRLGRDVVVFAAPDYNMPAQERLLAVKGLPAHAATPQDPHEAPDLYMPDEWKELKETAGEAEDLVAAFQRSRIGAVQTFVGPKALEERLKLIRSPRILHLATHGFFYPSGVVTSEEARGRGVEHQLRAIKNPLFRSGLVFAGANRSREKIPEGERLDDGWLTAEEVALQLELSRTELVVLSACESGLGDVQTGEGVYGLRRAFHYAGARTLVSSLFKIPDTDTRPLMKAFYENLAKDKGKLEALHEAQLRMLQGHREKSGAGHPFYWAGFVLIGDGDRLSRR
jgi:CHAT domain-containing protein